MELEWNQQRVTAEIMKYKELLDDRIITEKEFAIKEKELLKILTKKKSNSWFRKFKIHFLL
ncbi:hypothetical protein KPL37_17835 [Clostridium frigoris]|uniref:SHOCT domain-containing protein n=1 Tax=Clostridium frigoris TaxID=205327 RepID=A0ABS6BYB9_9CLOT|nr:hypothetical protein [Clostridium frigoris]MBU3161571.1 hypothetical protein [Clostridium frigoris]